MGDVRSFIVVVSPRWFGKGIAIFDVSTQNDIVDKLMGESSELETSVATRRRNNYRKFVRFDESDKEYSRHDVMEIISDYEVEHTTAETEYAVFTRRSQTSKRCIEIDDCCFE